MSVFVCCPLLHSLLSILLFFSLRFWFPAISIFSCWWINHKMEKESVSLTNACCKIAMSCLSLNRPTVYHRNILLIPECSEAGHFFFFLRKECVTELQNARKTHTKMVTLISSFQIEPLGSVQLWEKMKIITAFMVPVTNREQWAWAMSVFAC